MDRYFALGIQLFGPGCSCFALGLQRLRSWSIATLHLVDAFLHLVVASSFGLGLATLTWCIATADFCPASLHLILSCFGLRCIATVTRYSGLGLRRALLSTLDLYMTSLDSVYIAATVPVPCTWSTAALDLHIDVAALH